MIEVTQADSEAARQFILDEWPSWDADHQTVSASLMVVLARHRQQAEDAMRERCAAYVEGKGGVIPGATVFIPLITGDRMPCMSGDGRDKLNPHKRRYFDDATRDLATAIRAATLSQEVE